MNSLESVRTLIRDYLEFSSLNSYESLNVWSLDCEKRQKVYDAFFNLIADPAQSPDNLMNIIDTFTSGLDKFSKSTCLQTVIAFACVEGLARRRPKVLSGSWESITWMIIKYSSIINSAIGKRLINFKKANISTLTFITEYGSSALCPNPSIRLELFKWMSTFNCSERLDMYYDGESHRDKVIETLFELSDNYTSFKVDQFPNFSPIDLQFVIIDNSINMGSIMNDFELKPRISDIIVAVLKLTRNFVVLEKEKHQHLLKHPVVHESWHVGLEKQIFACLSFCGLLTQYTNNQDSKCILHLVQAVDKDPLLLNYVKDTLDIIKQVSLCLPDENGLMTMVFNYSNKIVHPLFKEHITNPTFQFTREINGGIIPAVEYRLRYFQNITSDDYNYHDSDYDSESSPSSDEDDSMFSFSEGNDSEIDTSD